MREYARILAIPNGEDSDAQGRKVGDDWLLAHIGCDYDCTDYYVTTNRIRASEVGFFELFEPGNLARFIVDKLNDTLNGLRECVNCGEPVQEDYICCRSQECLDAESEWAADNHPRLAQQRLDLNDS